MGRECKTPTFLNDAAATAVPPAEEMLMRRGKFAQLTTVFLLLLAGNHKFNVMPAPKRLPSYAFL